jgi:hypothetical protein
MCYYYSLPHVVPVLGSPMTTLPPPGRISTMSLLVLPHVVSDEGFPRPIVLPGLASIRSLLDLPQVVPVEGSPMTTLPPPGRISIISLFAFPQVVPVLGSPMTTLPPPPGRISIMSLFVLPQVVPVLGSPMTTLPPLLGRISIMSRLVFPHVVLEEGFPRLIVEPGVVEMRSGWEMGLVGCGLWFVGAVECSWSGGEKREVEVKECGEIYEVEASKKVKAR